MSENVVSLRGEPVRNDERPAQSIVDLLEQLLAEAKSGEIRGVAVAFFSKRTAGRNWISNAFAWSEDEAAGTDLLAATCRMKRQLERRLFADADDHD